MKFIRSLLLTILEIALALIAIDHAFSGLFGLPAHPILSAITIGDFITPETMAKEYVWRGFWGGILALLVIYWLVNIAIWRKRPKALQVRTANGEMLLINPAALLKFAKLQVENHPAVVSQKLKIRQKGSRGLSIWIWVNVRPIDSLPTITRQIEESIRQGFAQVMGIEKIDEVTIIVGLDEKSLSSRPGPLATPEPKPEPPLRGAALEEEITYRPAAAAGQVAASDESIHVEDSEKS